MRNDCSFVEYWQERAKLSYQYKGEAFYTVTPVPLYHKRREILLKKMENHLKFFSISRVLDFGCGDGWYVNYFQKKYPHISFTGIDLSENMLERARLINNKATFFLSANGVPPGYTFDFVYSIACFAHILDVRVVENIFKSICNSLSNNGTFIIFEQTGYKDDQIGKTWIRRNSSTYKTIGEISGFTLVDSFTISFPYHRFFEKNICKSLMRLFSVANANQSRCIIFLSRIFLFFDYKCLYPNDGKKDGNTFFIFKKTGN